MSIIYGSPLFLSSSSQNADLPPLLDNFKAFEGGKINGGIKRIRDLQLGDKIKVAVNPEFQSEFGNYMLFEKVDQDHEGYPENSSTFMAKNITMVRAMEGIYVYNTAMDFSLTTLSQYLNSNAGAGEWFQELIEGQVPPDGTASSTLNPDYAYADKPGFFNVLDNNFINKLLPTNIEHSTKEVYFFVPSVVEMGVKDQNNEGWSSAETTSSPFKWFDSDNKRTRALTSEVVSTYPDYKYELTGADESALYEANSPYYYTLRNMQNGNVFPIIRTDGTIVSTNYVVGKESCGICPVCNISNDLFLTPQEPDEDGCYIVDYNKIAVTIQADKMEESRAKELAGAVWVYGDHIPKNVNDGTKIQLTREEITRPDGEMYLTLNDVPASDAEIETIINIKESDGELHPYLYLSNDYLGSGAGLLLRKDCYQKGVWHVTGAIEVFNGSQFDVWCSNTFPTLLDTSISNILMEVDLPTKTTGAIRRKCFTLSNTEYGGSMYPAEGTALPYFKDNVRRQSMFNGGTVDYWTRSKYDVSQAYFIGLTGGFGQDMQTISLGYRPAFCLPLTFKLKATPNENGSYDMYDEVSDISTFASSEFIVEKSVSWEQTKNFFARQFTYNSKKQYQTMLEGAIAKIYSGQSITELPSGSKVKLGTWNDTPLQWKVARDTSDQSLRLVLEPISAYRIIMMAYDAAEPSNNDSDRKSDGNNRYIYSNIHQWLNATKVSGWYTPQHSADAAPAYASSPGFLSGWSETELNALDEAALTTTKASVDGGGTETFAARAALISTTELGLQSDTGGGRLDIFNADGDRAARTAYWTRTPLPSSSSYVLNVSSNGALHINDNADIAKEARPLCTPKSTTYVSLQPDSDGCYTITGVNE